MTNQGHLESALQKPNRIKRTPGRLPRIPFSTHQLAVLEDAYKESPYLSPDAAMQLADSLDLNSNRVKIWFQNRRARERRESREAETDASFKTPRVSEVSSSTSVSCGRTRLISP